MTKASGVALTSTSSVRYFAHIMNTDVNLASCVLVSSFDAGPQAELRAIGGHLDEDTDMPAAKPAPVPAPAPTPSPRPVPAPTVAQPPQPAPRVCDVEDVCTCAHEYNGCRLSTSMRWLIVMQ